MIVIINNIIVIINNMIVIINKRLIIKKTLAFQIGETKD